MGIGRTPEAGCTALGVWLGLLGVWPGLLGAGYGFGATLYQRARIRRRLFCQIPKTCYISLLTAPAKPADVDDLKTYFM
jgi:hypothetical protein